MPTLWIAEYANVARGQRRDNIPAGQEPAQANQVVPFAAAEQSAPFGETTQLVRLYASAACRVAFGVNPTATASSTPLSANAPEYFGVEPGHRLSVYDGVS